jgi:hypothetical protein
MRKSQREALAQLLEHLGERKLARLTGVCQSELVPVAAGKVAPLLSDRAKIITHLVRNGLTGHTLNPRDHDAHGRGPWLGPGSGGVREDFEQLGTAQDQRRFERATADGHQRAVSTWEDPAAMFGARR